VDPVMVLWIEDLRPSHVGDRAVCLALPPADRFGCRWPWTSRRLRAPTKG